MNAIPRKGEYQYWISGDGLTLVRGWARDGYTDKAISKKIGIAYGTIYEWKKRFPEFDDAIKKGKEVVDYEVENVLLNKAMSGDVTALIFWLSNRRSDRWKRNDRKSDKEKEAENGGVIIMPEVPKDA